MICLVFDPPTPRKRKSQGKFLIYILKVGLYGAKVYIVMLDHL